MKQLKKTARLTGVLYLILIVFGIINLAHVPSNLLIWENAEKTFLNIQSNEMLFRLGIVSGIIWLLAFIFLPLAFYRLLEKVNKAHAILMVAFAFVSIPISFYNLSNEMTVLSLINSPEQLNEFTTQQVKNQVMLFLEQYNNGVQLSQIFWGLWLFPLGYLVFKSGYIPKIIGILLMLGCMGFLIEFFGNFLFEEFFKGSVFSIVVGLPATFGELGICFFLLIKGINK